MTLSARLAQRLREAGLDPDAADPDDAFRRLLEHLGDRATVADRYELEAHHLGTTVGELSAERKAELAAWVTSLKLPGWEIMGSPRNDPVEVVPYDPAWPRRFDSWRTRLEAELGETAVRIEHIGSTSVPGLASKPIIDILVMVLDVDDEAAYVPGVEAAGVPLRSRDHGHRYFRPAPDAPRDVQIHVCESGNYWEIEHVLFRDYLRAHDDVRDAYAALKLDLAEAYRYDRLAYTDAKSEFILEALDAAKQWAALH